MTPTDPSVSWEHLSVPTNNWLGNAHRHDVQKDAMHIVTMPFVVVPMIVITTVSVVGWAVARRLHPMVVVVVMVMLQRARIAG